MTINNVSHLADFIPLVPPHEENIEEADADAEGEEEEAEVEGEAEEQAEDGSFGPTDEEHAEHVDQCSLLSNTPIWIQRMHHGRDVSGYKIAVGDLPSRITVAAVVTWLKESKNISTETKKNCLPLLMEYGTGGNNGICCNECSFRVNPSNISCIFDATITPPHWSMWYK